MADQSLPNTPERAAEAAARQAAAKARNANRPQRDAQQRETFKSSALGSEVQMPKSLPSTAAPRAAEATGRPIAPERGAMAAPLPRPATPVAPTLQDARANQSAEARMAPKTLPMAAPRAPAVAPRDVPRIGANPMGIQGAPPPMQTAVPSVDKMFQPQSLQRLPDVAKSASPDGNKFLANSQFNNIRRG